MDIRSKLNLYSARGAQHTPSGRNNQPLIDAGGEQIIAGNRKIWRFESRFSMEKAYTIIPDGITKEISSLLSLNGFDSSIAFDDLLFFDLETTSLSTGTGTYPFLCGIGYTDGDDFVCEQLFMEEYSDEPAILAYLLDFFNRAKAVVSFNGNTFDMPLIKNRYMINRVYGFPVTVPSFDLIVPARRIFRSVYENCALSTLEKNVLGFIRNNDTPGWMVPEIFFTYQKDGDASRIPGIINHNRYDIYSMYLLLQVLASIFKNISKGKYESLESGSLYALARYFYRVSPDIFLDLATFLGQEIIGDRGVFERFSIILKRKAEWERAVSYWERDNSYFSLIELAKYYEHRAADYNRAIDCCKKAALLLETLPPEEEKAAACKESVARRLARLIQRRDRS
ncbi:MAG: ribonuclease H-like domain-containing protein [Spirochaetota bacterium]